MGIRQSVGQRQFIDSLIATLRIDMSLITTSYSNAALTEGKHIATVKVGSGADSNLVSIRLANALGRNMSLYFQEVTLDCMCREDTAPGNQVATVRVLKLDGVTKQDAGVFNAWIFGTEGILEGNY